MALHYLILDELIYWQSVLGRHINTDIWRVVEINLEKGSYIGYHTCETSRIVHTLHRSEVWSLPRLKLYERVYAVRNGFLEMGWHRISGVNYECID